MNKIAKGVLYTSLGAAAYFGTFRNNSGLPPFFNIIEKDSSGICIGVYNEIKEGVDYDGFLLGFANQNSGRIYGVSVAIAGNISEGENAAVTGLEASLLFNRGQNRWARPSKTKGVQIALFNSTTAPKDCLTIGFEKKYEVDEDGE